MVDKFYYEGTEIEREKNQKRSIVDNDILCSYRKKNKWNKGLREVILPSEWSCL